ncbi:MAG TPA: hypothetical protein VMF66_05915 [Candidatus Acidoferrum sp.]|nr:hypothetical protein [Candidatus Acidoferrum sp.]
MLIAGIDLVLSTYIFGPFATMLPRPWRSQALAAMPIQLAPAAMLSGILEAVLAIAALIVWYSMYVTLAAGVVGHSSVVVPDQSANRIGMFAVVWFWLNPVTWLVAYFILEGTARSLAALATGEAYGVAPLWVLERIWRLNEGRRRNARPNLPLVADEITPGDGTCDMKIASCRSKPNWKYPFTIHYAGAYFQVIASVDFSAGPRPHVYSLRRLPPGEAAGGLADYDPADVLTAIAPLEPIEK